MQTSFENEKEYLSKIFKNLSKISEEICNVDFECCHFQNCNFTEAIFKKCLFIECTFTRCNLSVINVSQSKFTDVVFDECKMIGVDWTRASWPRLASPASLKFNKCILNDSSFFGLRLDGIAIEECKAHDVDFRDTSLCRAFFAYTDFTNSLFGKTNLSYSDFSEATNYDIDISNNKISKAKFSRYDAFRLLNSLDIKLVD